MTAPLVSILVPTYNGERFLADALASALAQTHREIEVVVGDDASTDGTPGIVAAAAEADARVRVLRHDRNVGAFENPIRLLEEARGEYVKFLLHDDLLAPDCVETLLAGMRSAPEVMLSFSHREMIDETGAPLGGAPVQPVLTGRGVVDGIALGDVLLESCLNFIGELTTVLFRKDDVDPRMLWHVDGRRLATLGDAALWLDLLRRGKAYYTPEPLSSFRRHTGQRSQDTALFAGGAHDWPLLIDWGRRHGFLADADEERRAHAQVLRIAAELHARMVGTADAGLLLETLFLATARLVELGGRPTDDRRPLADRAHGPAVLSRFTQELDVRAQRHPFALAAPAGDAREVEATVAAMREVESSGAAERLVVAVEEGMVGRLVPMLEAAIARGGDIDLELVPTREPADLLRGPWLAVAPRGGTWHRGRASAVWTI